MEGVGKKIFFPYLGLDGLVVLVSGVEQWIGHTVHSLRNYWETDL